MPTLPLRLRRTLLLLLFISGLGPWLLTAATCSQCRRPIPTGVRYLENEGRAFCSPRCFEATLPKCAACGKPCRGGFAKDGQQYCSRPCVETTLPRCHHCAKRAQQGVLARSLTWEERFFCTDCAAAPRCFCCNLPAAGPALADGRHLCRECAATAVVDRDAMLAAVTEVRRRLRVDLGLSTDHELDFVLVDEPTLLAQSGGTVPGRELGLYRHESTTERTVLSTTRGGRVVTRTAATEQVVETDAILLLTHLPLAKLREVAAHELAHDWMQQNHPEITDPLLKEGWAEQVAALSNASFGQTALTQRMAANPDPVYGEGYRQVLDLMEKLGGMPGLRQRFREISAAAPPHR